MKDRDVHPLLQSLFNDEALRSLDILQVDTTERRLESCHGFDKFLRVQLIDLDVENIDIGKFLEQYRLALHHRLGGQAADIAQPQNRRAIGDNGNQVTPGGIVRCRHRVFRDLPAGKGNPGRVGERQVPLVGKRLGRLDFKFPWPGVSMVIKCTFLQVFEHGGIRSLTDDAGVR